jgi:transketolase
MQVVRPADPEETAAAFAMAIARTDGPVSLILSRQNLPNLNEIPVEARRSGTLRGGYIARRESGELSCILLATGSEVQHALEAATVLGAGTRVVSLPSFEVFEQQDAAYRESVLPAACRTRVAIEAGVSGLWHKYTGLDGKIVSIDRFGLSAPGDTVMEVLGMTAQQVVEAAQSLGV